MRTFLAVIVAFAGAASMHVIVRAQNGQSTGGTGQNINVVTGSADQFTGDKFRQRQNESMVAVSSVNSAHMVVVYNDARTVDYPDDSIIGSQSPGQGFVAKVLDFFRAPWRRERERKGGWEADGPAAMPNQAWIGMSFTDNGGKSWYTGLHPGNYGVQIPADTDPMLPDTVELHNYVAANDPVIAATHNQFFVAGIAFNLPSPNGDGNGIGFVSRLTDRNNTEAGQNIHFDGTKVLLRSTDFVTTASTSFFVDKPSIAAAPGAPNGNAYVYAAFVVFDTTDPQKLSSKVLFYRSADSGASWSGPVTISQPLTRNQAPWIVVDPNNPTTVYVGWRVFANPLYPSLTNAIVGRRSFDGGGTFNPSVPYPVALLLKAFDQPQGNLSGNTLPSPRSAAYPSATIDGNGAIHVLMQEYVYPPNYATTGLRGLPLAPNALPTIGVPRITAVTSYNQGVTWTIRKAIDLGNGAGTQFMPTITAVGEPGPSCQGKAGPRSRVIAMFYDARPSAIGLTAGSYGIVSGGDKRFDVRIAQASACSANSLSGLTFSPSEQVSQYTRNATSPFDIVTKVGYGGITATATNNAYPMSCTGNCSFSGDYNHVTSRTGYVKVGNTWKLTTAVGVDQNALPAPVVQAVWADSRDALLPTTGLRPVTVAGESLIDQLEWNNYAPPGTGFAPCKNPGSRDQNIYTAEYTPGGLFASAPVTFKSSADIPRGYPLYIENRTPQSRSYLLTIDPLANASFDYTDFDPNVPQVLSNPPQPTDHNGFGEPYARQQAIVIGAISSVTGSVIVGPGVSTPVRITIDETNVQSPAVPAKTTVTLTPSPAGGTPSETYQPVIAPTPIVTKPLAGHVPLTVTPTDTIPSPSPFSPNPFSPNPFSPNPFSPNPFSPNPFSPNPFSPNPFSPNSFPNGVIVTDVTDISYVVTNEGEQTAAFNALANVQASGIHVYQLLMNRAVPTPNLIFDANGNCRAVDTSQAVPISTIGNPFSPNPFSPNPFSPNPFSPNPFSPNPFSPNAFPSEFSNATFYVKPSQPGSGTLQANAALAKYVADPGPDLMVATIRDFLIAGAPLTPQNVTFTVQAQAPNHDATSYVGTPPISGTHIPDHLVFTQQPTSTLFGQPISPAVQAAIVDAFGDTVTNSTLPVTMALGSNPTAGTLSGTLTKNAENGVATFSDLRISNAGNGYTLVASSGRLRSATSAPFNILAPDLVVSSGGVPTTSTVVPGGGVRLSDWTIKNQGSAGANAPTGTFRNGFYLSTDSLITGADTLLGTNNNTNAVLPAGGSFAWGGPTLTIPSNTAPGLYYIGVLVDDQNVVAESNEANNYFSTAITVVAGPQTFIVTNTNDSGPGSLRQALLDSNVNAGFIDTIVFAIPGNAPHTIAPSTGLPGIDDQAIIDAAPAGQCSGVPPTIEIDGSAAAAGPHGLFLAAPGTIIRGLSITGFSSSQSAGIYVSSSGFGSVIECSYLGLRPDGVTPKGNYNGIRVGYAVNTIGGTSAAVRNVISGNRSDGVLIEGPTTQSGSLVQNVVQGNYIGTDASGAAAVANGGNGVHIVNAGRNTVGGVTAAARNVISGNAGEGIRLDGAYATENIVQGNYIGTNASGSAALGNGASGVYIRRAPSNSVIGNLISGNIGFAGAAICGNAEFCGGTDIGTQGNNAAGNVIQGNFVGTNAAGSAPLGNLQRGVSIDGAPNTVVGGATAAARNIISASGTNGVEIFSAGADGNQIQGNVISGNTSAGVSVFSGMNNQIRSNSIDSNGSLGIDLGGDGVTPNDIGDSDTGANGLQNFPVITAASTATESVSGTLNSTGNTDFTIDLYANAACDASGFGQGQAFLGTVPAHTSDGGDATFTLSAPLTLGQQITATATDPNGNTSEFSNCFAVTSPTAAVNLAPSSAGTFLPGQSFNDETRAMTVTVLGSSPLAVSSMTLDGLSIPFGRGGAEFANVGARIYDGEGLLIASNNATIHSNAPVVLAISATLAPGASYKIGFYVQTPGGPFGSATQLVRTGATTDSFPPYTEPTGRFQITAAWGSSPAVPGDVNPTSPSVGLPLIAVTVTP